MKVSLTFVILLFSLCSFAQDLTGTWEGVMNTGSLLPGRQSTVVHLELKQSGKNITGIFYYASPVTKKMDVMYEVSARLSKKPFPFRLVRGAMLHRDAIDISFNQFENINYIKNDTAEILYGKWVRDQLTPLVGTTMGFAVKKIDSTYHLLDTELLNPVRRKKKN